MGTRDRQEVVNREALQEAQYMLPYHHLPRLYHWPDKLEYECYMAFIEGIIADKRPRSLLDVGCGDGRLIRDLGFGMGCDLSPRAIAWAQAMGLNCVRMDARDVVGKYEMVTAIEVLEHIPPEQSREFTKLLALRSQRWVLLSVPTTNAKLNPKHYHHYDYALLVDHIGCAFKIRQLWWIVDRPWWWSLVERLPTTKVEGFLASWMNDNIVATPETGRHLVCLGEV